MEITSDIISEIYSKVEFYCKQNNIRIDGIRIYGDGSVEVYHYCCGDTDYTDIPLDEINKIPEQIIQEVKEKEAKKRAEEEIQRKKWEEERKRLEYEQRKQQYFKLKQEFDKENI
jgi:hypothetical protein